MVNVCLDAETLIQIQVNTNRFTEDTNFLVQLVSIINPLS